MRNPKIYYSALDGKYHRYSGSPEVSKRFEAAGAVIPSDIADIEAVTILDQVLGLARPQYRLRGMCTPVRMDHLTQRVDLASVLQGQEKVPPLVEAELASQGYSNVNFDLWKNVVHVAISDEASKKAAHDILKLHISDAAGELARMENKQIAEVVEAGVTEKVSSVVYSDWGAVTSGVSDTSPLDAILASADYLLGKGYGMRGFFLALHPTLWRKFVLNTWIRDLVQAKVLTLSGEGFQIPGYPRFKLITDSQLTETPTGSVGPIVGATASLGVILGDGPVSAAKYRDEKAGYDAYVIRQWLEPQVVLDDALDLICT